LKETSECPTIVRGGGEDRSRVKEPWLEEEERARRGAREERHVPLMYFVFCRKRYVAMQKKSIEKWTRV
jgi:hypothetical protein